MSSNTWRSFGRIGAAITLGLVLLGCGQRAGMVPGGDSAVPSDVEVPDAYVMVDTGVCEVALETASCATDWSGCAPVEARPLVAMGDPYYTLAQQYVHTWSVAVDPYGRIGVVIRDRAAFGERWAACWVSIRLNETLPPDLPEVDFSSEMVIWYALGYSTRTLADYPEVWDCDGCLVFVPIHLVGNAEYPSVAFTAVAVPATDSPVQFEEPVDVTAR